MPFGIIGRTGPRMRQLVGFGDRSTGRGTFGANLGRAIVSNGDFTPRRGPLPKLVWADLLSMTRSATPIVCCHCQHDVTSHIDDTGQPCSRAVNTGGVYPA